jgi:hypothetical protein
MDNIYYMKSYLSSLPQIQATQAVARPLPSKPASSPFSFSSHTPCSSVERRAARPASRFRDERSIRAAAQSWLFVEEEYFPFDADGFEEQ